MNISCKGYSVVKTTYSRNAHCSVSGDGFMLDADGVTVFRSSLYYNMYLLLYIFVFDYNADATFTGLIYFFHTDLFDAL